MTKTLFTIYALLWCSFVGFGQGVIFEFNKKLGRGVNMGNMFEAPTETEWGNPFKDDYFQRISDLGFNHVRIPVRWDTPARTLQSEPYTIDRAFLERIKYVVDKALEENLYVIINMHHHSDIFSNPDQVKPRFLSQWNQIATYFKDYDNRLVFEVMNEPNTNLTPEKWNVFFADALKEIRKLSKSRVVLMGVANWGGLGSVAALQLPQDENIIVSIHYYEPFNFTHQGADWVADADAWLGTKWENTNLERDEVEQQFQYLKIFAKEKNVPIHIGEFGAFSRADLESRVKWTNFLARWFELSGFSWAYWEFSAGFGLFNPTTNQYLQPLADALTKNSMAPPVIVQTRKIFESKFTETDSEWNLYIQGVAGGTYRKANGIATIDVTQPSNDWWHVQFVKNNVALKKGSKYLLSFEASATVNAGFTNYVGKASGTYNAYSGYKGFTAIKDFLKYSYTFTMFEPDDPNARIVFDMGSTKSAISIKNVVLQEILPNTSTAVDETEADLIKIYPNPTHNDIILEGVEKYNGYTLLSMSGVVLDKGKLNNDNETTLSLTGIHEKQVLLLLHHDKTTVVRKILRVP